MLTSVPEFRDGSASCILLITNPIETHFSNLQVIHDFGSHFGFERHGGNNDLFDFFENFLKKKQKLNSEYKIYFLIWKI